MRRGLVGVFDVGRSYGLGDDVFAEAARAPAPDISLVGIEHPLGHGVRVDLSRSVLSSWRAAACAQARRPEMETGWSPELGLTRAEFDDELARLVDAHPVERCELRVHAVGAVLAELFLGPGLPARYQDGVSACFEYAAYTPDVADQLLAEAERGAQDALLPGRSGLVELSRRALPEVQADSKGYEERLLIPSFTHVVCCIDEGDDEQLEHLLADADLDPEDAIAFEYHGRMHFGWGTCVLEPSALGDWQAAGKDRPEDQILRMLEDIRLAHVFLGTCDAFVRLCTSEIHEQVGGYVGGTKAGRPPEALNRLRTLSLAVINLTDFGKVTEADEDRAYFRRFNAEAGIEGKQRTIQEATETLYNVQVAESQRDDARRQWVLSVVVGLLTSLTLISVTVDAYDFLRQDDPLIESRGVRGLLLLTEVLLITAVLGALVTLAVRAPRRRG